MPVTSTQGERIAKNTFLLYLRMFFVVGVGLYTSRVVLKTLGVEDYGVYSVVGSIVAMMGFLNSAMSSSTARFITYELGVGDDTRLNNTFSSAVIVHFIIALLILFLAESLGLWYLNNKLVIPEQRVRAAHWVYQFSILTAMMSITQVPYNSCIIAHEEMNVFAYIEILNALLKLGIVYVLFVVKTDKLIVYAILMFSVSSLIRFIYRFYAIRNFRECHFHWIWDKSFLLPLVSFTGWSLYPSFCFTTRQQGINLILNRFGGAIINAASGLATTVFNIIEQFSSTILTAARPPIIKLYAKNEFTRMLGLTINISTIANLLYGLLVVPIIFECHYLLSFWLGSVPQYTESFCILLLISSFFSLNNNTLYIILQAQGNIKSLSLLSGTTAILVLPVLFILLVKGLSFDFAYILSIINSSLIYIYSLIIAQHSILGFRAFPYFMKTMLRSCLCLIPSILLIVLIQHFIEGSFIRLCIVLLASVLTTSIIALLFVFPKEIINRLIDKVKGRNGESSSI